MEIRFNHRSGQLVFIILTSLVTVILLFLFDRWWRVSYPLKSFVKIVLFSLTITGYCRLFAQNLLQQAWKNRRHLIDRWSLLIGLGLILSLLLAYMLLGNSFNLEQIRGDFSDKYQIPSSQLLGYGLYLSLINAFLEELFFRGFILLGLWRLGYRSLALYYSSSLFALYHLANLIGWSNWQLLLLALVSLFAAGLIFAALTLRRNSFINSYFVHMCADLAIVGIGLHIFAQL